MRMGRKIFLACALLVACATVGIVLWKAFVPAEPGLAAVGTEVFIRTTDHSQLVAAGRTLFGATTDPGGTTYISQRGGTMQAELFVWNKTTGNTGRFLAWREGAGATAILYAARGVDAGATAEPNGSLWRNTGGDIFFAHGGRIFASDRVQIQNNVSGTNLHIFSDSARTSLLATVAAGSTWTDSTNRRNYWLRLAGVTNTHETFNVDLFGTLSGFLYRVDGSYTAGSETIGCTATFVSTYYSNVNESTEGCGVNPDGSCVHGGLFVTSCVYHAGIDTWECTTRQCDNVITGTTPPSWSGIAVSRQN